MTVNSETRVRGWFRQRNTFCPGSSSRLWRRGSSRVSQRAQPGPAVHRLSESRTAPALGPENEGARLRGAGEPAQKDTGHMQTRGCRPRLLKASGHPLRLARHEAGPPRSLKPSVRGPALTRGLWRGTPAGQSAATWWVPEVCALILPATGAVTAATWPQSVRAGAPPVTARLLRVRPGRRPFQAQPMAQPCSAGRAAPAGVTE